MAFTASQIASVSSQGSSPVPSFDPNGSTMQTLNGPSQSQSYPSKVLGNLGSTFSQGGQNVMSDISNTPNLAAQAGSSPLAKIAAVGTTAGHVAGDIAGTAGGILSSFIAPLLPDSVKNGIGNVSKTISDKVNSIPGMTPEIAKSLGDVFNTSSLEAGGQAEEPVANIAKDVGGKVSSTINDTVGNIKDSLPTVGAKTSEASAVAARESAAQAGIKSLQDMTESVGDYKNDLGTSFKKGAADIEKNNPSLKLSLTKDQMSALNQLKDNKSFALPSYLKTDAVPNSISDIENSHQLSPTQAQDLITQLNRSTFTDRAGGLGIDQSKVGLTNEIKSAASDAFGKDWQKVYGDYAKGANAVDKIGDIINIDKNATASDVNKNLNSILKLSKTPEGKIILQNSISEFKNVSGIDLSPGKDVIGQILDKQDALEKASKPGLVKQLLDPKYIGRRAIGGAISIGLLYPAIRAIQNAAK